ncbi:MAG: hypothetical protein JWM57_1153 [Phycisphaerales bacterium]|nr:hypothetical protein [Phycisphaerales bacterium]
MALHLIEQLLADPDPAFACIANSDPTNTEGYLAPLLHLAGPPGGSLLRSQIPDVPGSRDAAAIYAAHDGMLLYTDAATQSEGVEIFPIGQWKERTKQMVESWVEDNYPDDDMPYGHDDFIAFGHSRGASSYLHWVIRGPKAGSIYWWPWTMRPERYTPPMAATFADFVTLLYEKPAFFFNELLLCYTRFSDGRTGKEWLPNRYVPDRQKPAVGR